MRARWFERAFVLGAYTCAFLALGVLVLLIVAIAARGLPAVDWDFVSLPSTRAGAEGGVLWQLVGTAILVGTAAVVCVPLAVGVALTHGVYLKSPGARRRLEVFLFAFNGIPSILFGIFGLIVFTGVLGWDKSWLAGGILLALVILPTVSVAMIERIAAIPQMYYESAAALGLGEAQIVRSVVLPQSFGALMTGLFLGLARAAGETAPILFTATVFAGATLPTGVRDSPVLSLPYHVFVLAQDSLDPSAAQAVWGTATVLLILVVGSSALALPLRLPDRGGERSD